MHTTSQAHIVAHPVDAFLKGSANLLEFSLFTLQGTGVGKTLHGFISGLLGAELFNPWIERLAELPANPAMKAQAIAQLLADPCYGPLTRNLMLTWYTGNWNPLPASWHAAYHTAKPDEGCVISSQTYQEGLVWPLVGAHPPGAKQQGWDAWSRPPSLVPLR